MTERVVTGIIPASKIEIVTGNIEYNRKSYIERMVTKITLTSIAKAMGMVRASMAYAHLKIKAII